ncbi:MAG TPA: MFS transporter [Xanthobacteraceae bacterium]|nr:MFS transporter [Xanthobacteraceae bacterium]
MTVAAPSSAAPPAQVTKLDERRAFGVACGAHALHDGYTDLVYVMLPIWQKEFAISYAAIGLLRTCFSGTMAALQIPSGLLSERFGIALVLAIGTALVGVGYCVAGMSTGFVMLVVALLLGGTGASTQHPLASALVARAFSGPRSLKALGTYNFAGDIGKMTMPAAAALLLALMPWQPVLAMLGLLGFIAAVGIYHLTPRLPDEPVHASGENKASAASARGGRFGFPLLLSIGVIDSATRMAFLTFLPFVLVSKGASLQLIGMALTLVFAGGAVGKFVCTFIGARIGVIPTVYLTEGLTTAGIIAILPLPLEVVLVLLPIIGVALNGTSSVVYGSVPELVAPEKRRRAFSVFYTGTIGSGAVSPAIYGWIGDDIGLTTMLGIVAGLCLLTLPLAMLLKPALEPVRA